MQKSTEELLAILKESSQLSDYTDNQNDEFVHSPIAEYLNKLILQKKLKLPLLIQQSGLDRNYCYQILDGRKHPSRNKVLAICFAMKLSFEEVQQLLKATGYPILYPRIERDSAIIFCLQKNTALSDVNELLYDLNYKELS